MSRLFRIFWHPKLTHFNGLRCLDHFEVTDHQILGSKVLWSGVQFIRSCPVPYPSQIQTSKCFPHFPLVLNALTQKNQNFKGKMSSNLAKTCFRVSFGPGLDVWALPNSTFFPAYYNIQYSFHFTTTILNSMQVLILVCIKSTKLQMPQLDEI